jgi:hypothetical protein
MRQPRSCRSTSRTSKLSIIAGGRAAHFAVEAEHRDAMHRVDEVGRLDHVVLLVAAQAVLRAEGGAQLESGRRPRASSEWRQVGGDRRRVGEQGDALAGQRAAQRGFGDQAVN